MNGIWVQVLQALWKRRGLIVVVTAVVCVGSALSGWFSGRTYEARRYVLASEFNLEAGSKQDSMVNLASILPEPISPQVYSTLLLSPNLVGTVLDELEKKNAFKDSGTPDLFDFIATLYVKVEQVDPTARPIRYSPAVMLSATSDSPELARDIVETWAKQAVRLASRLRGVHLVAATSVLGKEQERIQTELKRVQDELAQEKARWNLDIMKNEMTDRQKEIARLETQLNQVGQDLASSEQTAAVLRETLEKESPIVKLFRAPSDDAYFIITQQEKAKADTVEKAGMISEEINEVYITVSTEEKLTQSKVAGMRAGIEDLNTRLAALRTAQDAQKNDYATHEQVQAGLTRDVGLYTSAYEQVASTSNMVQSVELLATSEVNGATPLALGYLDMPVYPIVAKPLVSRSVMVLFRALVGFILICGYVVAIEVAFPMVKRAMAAAES